MRYLVLIITLLFFPCTNCFADCVGKVASVTDGDTLVIECDRKTTIRLDGVDAPELAQPCGPESQFFVSSITSNIDIVFVAAGKDKDGVPLGNIILPDGKILNQEVVKAGYAWYYPEYSKNKTLSNLEKEAREKKSGLWIDAAPEAPWDFRSRSFPKTIAEYDTAQSTSAQATKIEKLAGALSQSASAQWQSPVVGSEENIPPTKIPKLPLRNIGKSFRYAQYRLNDVEREEYYNLSSLKTFSKDQVSRFVLLDRKVSIEMGDGGGTVYIIRNRDEYHRISCPELGKTPDNYIYIANDYSFPIPLNRAKLAFYPCPICEPPQ